MGTLIFNLKDNFTFSLLIGQGSKVTSKSKIDINGMEILLPEICRLWVRKLGLDLEFYLWVKQLINSWNSGILGFFLFEVLDRYFVSSYQPWSFHFKMIFGAQHDTYDWT